MKTLGNSNMSKTGDVTITIEASGAVSQAVDCRGRQAIAFIVPIMTSTSLAVHASSDNVTFYPAYYNGVAVTIAASGTATWQSIPSNTLAGANYIRLVPNGTEAAKRSITVIGLQLVN